jgi:hypothetical protein
MTEHPVPTPDQQRRAAMRTVWILAAVALALFGGTIWSFLHP